MQTESLIESSADRRYARVIENSRRIRWDVDKDVFRGRGFDFSGHFLPDGLSKVNELEFGLVERFISAKVLELSRHYWLGDQVPLEALVGFSQEELKHQEMFRRIERMIAEAMPDGYRFVPEANEVATAVLKASTWAVLALTCHIELFVQAHYIESIQPDSAVSPLFKDVFLFHWKDESQHVTLDELEWTREDRQLTPAERDRAVDDFIGLVGAVDGILQAQAAADVSYFRSIAEGRYDAEQVARAADLVLRAYRSQYILSGAEHPRFRKLLLGMITPEQGERVARALAPLTR